MKKEVYLLYTRSATVTQPLLSVSGVEQNAFLPRIVEIKSLSSNILTVVQHETKINRNAFPNYNVQSDTNAISTYLPID